MANATVPKTIDFRRFEHGALEVKVVLTKEFKVRTWIAIRLIWLAARILGLDGVEVSASDGASVSDEQ